MHMQHILLRDSRSAEASRIMVIANLQQMAGNIRRKPVEEALNIVAVHRQAAVEVGRRRDGCLRTCLRPE